MLSTLNVFVYIWGNYHWCTGFSLQSVDRELPAVRSSTFTLIEYLDQYVYAKALKDRNEALKMKIKPIHTDTDKDNMVDLSTFSNKDHSPEINLTKSVG